SGLNHPAQRAGVSKVVGRQGDEQTLTFLLEHVNEVVGSKYEQEAALAIGRLMLDDTVGTLHYHEVIKAAFSAEQPKIVQAWLYGFYRSSGDSLDAETKDLIYSQWQAYGVGHSPKVDQYIAKVLGSSVFAQNCDHHHKHGTMNDKVQLGVELARSLSEIELSSSNKQAIKKLLLHPNPHVLQQALTGLSGKLLEEGTLTAFIREKLIKS